MVYPDHLLTVLTPAHSSRMEDVARKFEAAWDVFTRTCAGSVAPVTDSTRSNLSGMVCPLPDQPVRHRPRRSGADLQALQGELNLDVVVMRERRVNLPHYVHRGDDGTGMATLRS